MAVWALVPFAFAGYTAALPFRAADVLGWQERELAVLFTMIGIVAAFVQGYLFGRIVKRIGERTPVIVGTFGMALAIGIVPLVGSSFALYAWTFLLAVSNSLFSPAATGLVSVYADPTEQGTILGAAQAIAALGRTAGPPLVGAAYDAWHGGAFVLAGGVMVLAGLAALRLAPISHTVPGHALPPLAPPVPSVPPPPAEP
jgi:MFS family permease